MSVFHLAIKDLRLLFRDKMALFFVIGFPVLLGLFFGSIFGGPESEGGTGKLRVAVVDQDSTAESERFLSELQKNDGLEVELAQSEAARQSVRLGRRAAMLIIPEGFGEKAGLLWEEQPEMQIGVDPSRRAESAMLEGMVMQAIGSMMGDRFRDPGQFLPSIREIRETIAEDSEASPFQAALIPFLEQVEQMVEAADAIQTSDLGEDDRDGFQFNLVNLKTIDVTRTYDIDSPAGQLQKIRSPWDISFPQAMMWGIMGCVAGFSLSVARERARGTFVRLCTAPLTKTQILVGKALACFTACLLVMLMMTALGISLGMKPLSLPKLAAAGLATSFCFVGIMMTMSVVGKSEESVAGIGWAANIVMAMFGGGMVPVMFMPAFMQWLSPLSPIYWAVRIVEGAIWRDFTWLEMLPALAILLSIGLLGTFLGASILYRHDR